MDENINELVKKYIAEQLRNPDFRFNLIRKKRKEAIEKEWEKEVNYKFYDKKLINYINSGGNFGIIGGFGNLILIDSDSKEVDEKCKLLPETFTIKTGSKVEYKKHYYYFCDEKFKMRFSKEKVGDLGDIRSSGQYVIAPNSTHPDGDKYKVIKDIPIVKISKAFIESIFKEIIDPLTNIETETEDKKYLIDTKKRQSPFIKNCNVPDYVLNNKLKGNTSKNWKLFPYVIDILNARGVSLELYERLAKIQEHNIGAVKGWVKKAKEGKLAKCSCKKMREYLQQYHPELINDICSNCSLCKKLNNKKEEEEKLKELSIDKAIKSFTDKRNLAEQFIKIQPLYYDGNKIWWIWDEEEFKWKRTDKTNILNAIAHCSVGNTINSKEKVEILEALEQIGRENNPEENKESWIQFKNKIYDIENGEELEASPKYFVTNPIPYALGKEEETPIIDELFISWVGEEHKQELYEIIAFCIIPNYFIHRMFCLIGSGANGKSTYLRILEKFIGIENITSSSLNLLMKERFEGSKLLNKLVCLMGETNFNLISNTDYLKKLTGEDLVRCEFKGKDGFDFRNYAKLIMATNSLPPTADKTDGFYRRWKIIDFSNKFKKEKDVLSNIPETEYNNLALKCLNIVRKLWIDRKFTNDGDFEKRKLRYEDKSNPLNKFIKENYIRDVNKDILFNDFFDNFIIYLEERGARILSSPAVSKQLKNEGFEVKLLTKDSKTGRYILGLNNISNLNNLKSVSELHRESSKNLSNLSNLSNYSKGNNKNLCENCEKQQATMVVKGKKYCTKCYEELNLI